MDVGENDLQFVKVENDNMQIQAKNSSSTWRSVSKRLGFDVMSQMCSAPEGSVISSHQENKKVEKLKEKHRRVIRKLRS